jgi:hypothetical protein
MEDLKIDTITSKTNTEIINDYGLSDQKTLNGKCSAY